MDMRTATIVAVAASALATVYWRVDVRFDVVGQEIARMESRILEDIIRLEEQISDKREIIRKGLIERLDRHVDVFHRKAGSGAEG